MNLMYYKYLGVTSNMELIIFLLMTRTFRGQNNISRLNMALKFMGKFQYSKHFFRRRGNPLSGFPQNYRGKCTCNDIRYVIPTQFTRTACYITSKHCYECELVLITLKFRFLTKRNSQIYITNDS